MHHTFVRALLDRHLGIGEQPDQLDQKPARDDNGALCLDLGLQRRAQRQLHVGRGERQLPAFRAQQDAAENLDGCARRDPTGDDPELLGQLLAGTSDLHRPGANHGFCIKHLSNSSRRSHRECGLRGRRRESGSGSGFAPWRQTGEKQHSSTGPGGEAARVHSSSGLV